MINGLKETKSEGGVDFEEALENFPSDFIVVLGLRTRGLGRNSSTENNSAGDELSFKILGSCLFNP